MESKLVRKVQELYKNKAKWKEGLHLEFKRGQNGVPGSLWETYSAFANTGGGLIVVGTDDNGDVVGVPQAETKLKDIVNNINNPGKCSVNLCAESGRIAILALDGKDVIVLDVPAAAPEQKPDIMVLKDDLTGVKSDFMAPKDDLTGVKSDFMVPKDDLTGVKSDFMVSREPVLSAQERVAKELNLPWQLEAKITEYRQKERQSPEVTMSLVIEICRNRWVTAVQLSILLDRAVRPLRKNFLQPAILCRKLEHRHPDSHKNKNQAYRTIE